MSGYEGKIESFISAAFPNATPQQRHITRQNILNIVYMAMKEDRELQKEQRRHQAFDADEAQAYLAMRRGVSN